jgi:hypothetical protein
MGQVFQAASFASSTQDFTWEPIASRSEWGDSLSGRPPRRAGNHASFFRPGANGGWPESQFAAVRASCASSADIEVAGVVDGVSGRQSAAFVVVLLDARSFVVDAQ